MTRGYDAHFVRSVVEERRERTRDYVSPWRGEHIEISVVALGCSVVLGVVLPLNPGDMGLVSHCASVV